MIYREWGPVLLEVDEEQHSHYPVSCETARVMDIIAEHVKAGRSDKLKIIRFNPDAFKLDFQTAKVLMKDRHIRLLEAIRDEPGQQFEIRYMFYDQSSPFPEVCLDPDFPKELRDLVGS